MMRRSTYCLVVLALALAGCSSPGAQPVESPTRPSAPSTTSAAALGPVAQRCGLPDVPARVVRLSGPGRARLFALEVGEGPTTAVFLHETGPSGLCGFWPYAVWLKKNYHLRSLLLDFCGFGQSQCRRGEFADDLVAQADLAVAWLRKHGGRRVTLVGASMGGTVAAVASTRINPPVDALVDLSGPLQWDDLDVVAAAPKIKPPALFAAAPNDSAVSVTDLREALRRTSAQQQRFLTAPYGHGWQTLGSSTGAHYAASAVGRQVARWIQGG